MLGGSTGTCSVGVLFEQDLTPACWVNGNIHAQLFPARLGGAAAGVKQFCQDRMNAQTWLPGRGFRMQAGICSKHIV